MSAIVDLYDLARMHTIAKPELNQFFLIDSSGVPMLRKRLSRAELNWCPLFEAGVEERELAVPILVSIVSAGRIEASKAFCAWLAEHSTYTSTVSVISTPLTITSLRRRISSRLHAQLTGGIEVLLRFFDPRVFESLMSTLTAEQRWNFLELSESWSYINRAGEFLSLSAKFNDSDNDAPLLLDQGQEDELIKSAEIDNILNLVRENTGEIIHSVPMGEQYARVRHAYEMAVEDNVEATAAMVLYVTAILMKGSGCRRQAYWSGFLGKLRNGELLEASQIIN